MFSAKADTLFPMKPISFVLTILGLGLVTFLWQTGTHQAWHLTPTFFTWSATLVGGLALVVLWVQPQIAMVMLFGASFMGVPGWFTVWAGPGSFFMTAALVLLIAANQNKPPRAP